MRSGFWKEERRRTAGGTTAILRQNPIQLHYLPHAIALPKSLLCRPWRFEQQPPPVAKRNHGAQLREKRACPTQKPQL